MFAIKNFTDNDDVRVLGSMGPFTVVEYLKDLSVTPSTAMTAYYCNEMNVRKRQVICARHNKMYFRRMTDVCYQKFYRQ